MIATMG